MSTAVLKIQQPEDNSLPEPVILAAAVATSPDPLAIREHGNLIYANRSFATLTALAGEVGESTDHPAWRMTDFVAGLRTFTLTTLQRETLPSETLQLAMMGRMVGGVAHDFNNLLTGILLYCDLLQPKVPLSNPLATKIDEIRRAAEQGAGIIRQLMTLGREDEDTARSVSFNHAITELTPMLRHLAGENIQISTELGEDAGVVGISLAQAQQIVLNLVLNARDAMPQGGSVHLQTSSREFEGTGPATRIFELTVRDTGAGMDTKVAARVFEPFFTTKPRGRGTGMGLTTVRKIVEDAGGIVCMETAPSKGTRMTVRLPEIEVADQIQTRCDPARIPES